MNTCWFNAANSVCAYPCMTVCLSSAAGVTGKYYSNGEETESSEESRDEEKQQKLWQLSGG